jgi:hypothetical protein
MVTVKIPKKIKIGGYDYKIVSNNTMDIDLTSNGWVGSQSLMQQKIQLLSSLSGQSLTETFIHELLHAISITYDSNKLAEEDIGQLSMGMLQVLEQLGIRFER